MHKKRRISWVAERLYHLFDGVKYLVSYHTNIQDLTLLVVLFLPMELAPTWHVYG